MPNNVDAITALQLDGTGKRWIGTRSQGLARLDGSAWTSFRQTPTGLPFDKVLSLARDPAGTLLVGTDNGPSRWGGSYDKLPTSASPLPSNQISALAADPQGGIWIGTEKGLAHYRDSAWKIYRTGSSPLADDAIRRLVASPDGTLWIASAGGCRV